MRFWLREFRAEGLNLERLIQMMTGKGICITGMKRSGARVLEGCVREDCLPLLMEVAEKGGWRVTQGKRRGSGAALDRMKKRPLLAAMLVFMAVVAAVSTQIVWHVEIIDAGAYEAEVRMALEEYGVRPPMLKRQIDPGEIRDALEWRFPRVAWVECGWRGMTLDVRLVQGVMPASENERSGACDVVAERDGIVSSIVTRAGTPVVRVGELVRRGQVLIRGEERTAGGEARLVAARGSVIARVWDSVSVRTPLHEMNTTYTGREQTSVTVRTPWFDLWRMEQSPFDQQDVSVQEQSLGGFFIPMVIRTETRMEAEYASAIRDLEAVKAESAAAALQKLYGITGGKESLVDNWVNWSIIEDEILLSVATGERLVDIARQERSSVMAAAE